MRIRITGNNREKIDACLGEVNRRAHRHVWSSYDELARDISQLEEILEAYGLPKTYREGAQAAMYSVNPRSFANNYDNRVYATEAELYRTRQGWVLTGLERAHIGVGSGSRHKIYRFEISPEQAEICDAAWRRSLRISLRKTPQAACR